MDLEVVMDKRWYDKIEKGADVIERLQKLDKQALARISKNLEDIAASIKTIKREQDELPISIGIERVKGLYQQSKNRRWYDKDSDLSYAIKAISTLSEDEYSGIMEALDLIIAE